jgi:hypothetical protein
MTWTTSDPTILKVTGGDGSAGCTGVCHTPRVRFATLGVSSLLGRPGRAESRG